MLRNLVLTIRLHDGRYHGMGEWGPSPARVFQALVAGAARGGVDASSAQALEWLESLGPPTIGMPPMRTGQRLETFVPDNDIDTVDGDPARVGDIRSSKTIEPKLFDLELPFLYVWMFDGSEEDARQARAICALAERLYQFGRGVDMAWASGEVLDAETSNARLSTYRGVVHKPSVGRGGRALPCPARGSLASLEARHAAGTHRFKTDQRSPSAKQFFSHPPKPRFAQIEYDSPPSRRITISARAPWRPRTEYGLLRGHRALSSAYGIRPPSDCGGRCPAATRRSSASS